jgi:hypothetical protein
MKTLLKSFLAVSLLAVFVTSCKKDKDDDQHEHDHEVIGTVNLKFTKAGTGEVSTFSWKDLDGDGGNPPVIQELALDENAVYNVSVELLDIEGHDLTHDIEDHEADHHRFYYEVTVTGGAITISDLDKDDDGVTLGLKSKWTTTGHSEGTVKITLRHYQNDNKAEADLVNSSKSATDAELVFPVHVH